MSKRRFLEADFRIREWLIRPQLNCIVDADRSTSIEPKVMEVLVCLAEQAGQVIPKEELIQRIWVDTFVTDDVLIRAISELRRAFGDDPRDPAVIRTIPKRGYQLVGTVQILDDGIIPDDGRPGHPGAGNGSSGSHGNGGPPQSAQGKGSADESLQAFPSAAPPHSGRECETRPNGEPAHRSGLRQVVPRWVIWAIPFLPILLLGYYGYEVSRFAPRVTRIVQLTDTGRPKGGLATDGSRIYFSEYRDGHNALAAVSVSGGDTVPIECPFQDVRLLDISPDGLELLVLEGPPSGSTMPLWIMPAAGGNPRRVGNVHVHYTSGAAWSPRGDRIAYSTLVDPAENPYEAAIYLVGTDGMNPQTLVTTPFPANQILWSPDGGVLRYSLGTDRWEEVPADGSDPRPLLIGRQNSPLQGWGSRGTWTRDGRYFFFTSLRETLQDLWVLKEDALFGLWRKAKPFRFTPGPFDVIQPLVSRDGRKVFCTAKKPGAELSRIVPATGLLEPYLSGISAEMPDISRDGQWVVYVSLPEATLIRSRIDGRDRIQLTSPPMWATLPVWSPDGKEIAFTARAQGETGFKIYLISGSGADLRMVTPGIGPSWSPDGRRLLFENSAPQNSANFHILDLTTDLITDVPDSEDKIAPRWSSDGRYIAATAQMWSRVVVFDFATRAWSTLAATYGDGVFFPTWSRDGQSIFYIEWTPGYGGVYRARMSGGEPELVFDTEHCKTTPRVNYPGTLGGWFGLAPDDSILFAVQQSQAEIYALEWEEE